MSSAPLLPMAAHVDGVASHRENLCACSALAFLREWWAMTMNPRLRSSPMSRRALWKWLPILVGIGVFPDVIDGAIWAPAIFYWDLSFLGLSIAMAKMPTVPLWSDTAASIWLVAANVVCICNSASFTSSCDGTILVAVGSIVSLFTLFSVGVHSSMILTGAVAMWIALVTSDNVHLLSLSAVIGPVMGFTVILMLTCEATTAYYFRLLEKSMSENERLLNDATVSCTVNRVTGRVSECSYPASSLLGLNPNGGRIFESVRSQQERAAFCSFCAQGVDGALPEPILVTMNHKRSWDAAPVGELDMKVVQYRTSHNDDVKLLFELTGEVRINSQSDIANQRESQAGFEGGANQPAADMASSMGMLEIDSSCCSLSQDTGLPTASASAASFAKKCNVGTQTESLPPAIPNTQGAAEATGRRPLKFRAPLIGNVNLKTRKLVMNEFVETPNSTIYSLVCQSLLQFNPRGKGCCSFHIGLQVLLQCILDMTSKPCNGSHQPNCGWQCRHCFALHEAAEEEEQEDGLFCTVCFRITESVVEEHAQPAQQLQQVSSSCPADDELTSSAGSNRSSDWSEEAGIIWRKID